MLLTPRDYLSTFMKIGVIVLLAVGLVIAAPVLQNEAVTDFAIEGTGPVFAGKLFPFVFITIACGALSGFHALIASGTTPKMVAKESQVRMIGYGGMLMESFVAISALIAASVIDQGLYFAMNSPAGATGGDAGAAAEFVRSIGFTISPADLTAAAQSIEEETLISRTGGAPTLAFGISLIFSEAFGGGLAAFWYHFAIMFEALFILTAVDAGTRVGRFMLQDTIGNLWPKYADISWKPASWSASAIVVGHVGLHALRRGDRPPRRHQPALPAVRHLQPAARRDRPDPVRHAADQARQGEVGLGARHRPGLGPHRHHDRELPEGLLRRPEDRLLHPARRPTRTPSTRGGCSRPRRTWTRCSRSSPTPRSTGPCRRSSRSLVIVIVVNALIIWVKAVRAGGLPTTEVPKQPSHLVAPSDFFATKEEKEAVREWEASERERLVGGRR